MLDTNFNEILAFTLHFDNHVGEGRLNSTNHSTHKGNVKLFRGWYIGDKYPT